MPPPSRTETYLLLAKSLPRTGYHQRRAESSLAPEEQLLGCAFSAHGTADIRTPPHMPGNCPIRQFEPDHRREKRRGEKNIGTCVQYHDVFCCRFALDAWYGLQSYIFFLRFLLWKTVRGRDNHGAGGQYAGTALTETRRRKDRTYPELLHSRRSRFVVGGEAARFVTLLAHAKA